MLLSLIAVLSLLIALGICLGSGAFLGLGWLWILPVGFLGSFLAITLLYFLFLLVLCKLVDPEKPQEKDSAFYRTVMYLTIGAVIPIVQAHVHTAGLEKTPKSGRFLLVCNHLNEMDPLVLHHFFSRSKLAFISKRENRDMFLIGKIMHKTMCQMINRENDREALKTILKCIQLIKDDEVSVAVFPEGYIHDDHLLHPFRYGVFKIAQKANVPIVVCTLQNTQYVFHNAKRLKPTHVELHLVDVIPAEELSGVTAVEIGERVYAMMAADLGPDLVYHDN